MQLTQFFHRVGFANFNHDGSTRKWWTLGVLQQLSENNLKAVLLRLASPHEYGADRDATTQAVSRLNEILALEGLQIVFDGVKPKFAESTAQFVEHPEERELKPLPPPDFLKLKLEPGLGEVLSARWGEAQMCVAGGAHTMGTVAMGSLLEGMLLAVLQADPAKANQAAAAPKNSEGKVKPFWDWSLSETINVAHEVGWIGLDVKKFSHSLREFRNLIHPYQQWVEKTWPDADTCSISWLVVQAAANDLAKHLE
jgi:hypothetical protein